MEFLLEKKCIPEISRYLMPWENRVLQAAPCKALLRRGDPQPASQMGVSYDLDPREVDCDKATGPVEELEDIPVSEIDEEICLKLGKNLAPKVKFQLTDFLKVNFDVFAWNHKDMVGIALEVMSHRLNVDPIYKTVCQKSKLMTLEQTSS